MEEWISTKRTTRSLWTARRNVYPLREELPPYAEGLCMTEDMEFEVKEDGSDQSEM